MTISAPNFTQIPNAILDSLHNLKGGEAKTIMAICRSTFGYHQKGRRLSLSYLQKTTGLSRQGVINATKSLISLGWVNRHSIRVQGGESWEYEVNLEVVKKVDRSNNLTSQKSRPEVVKKVDTLNKELNKDLSSPLPPSGEHADPEGEKKEDVLEGEQASLPTGQQQEPAQRHSGESSVAAIPAYGHFGQYQGSKVFLEERPWVDQWRNVNPTYNDGFMKWCTPKLEKFDSYKAGAKTCCLKKV